MPRPHRFELPNQARYLTCSCYQRLPLFTRDRFKNEFVDALVCSRDRHHFLLFAWVLMPEHFHLILLPNLSVSNVTQILRSLKTSVGRRTLSYIRATDDPIMSSLIDSRGVTHFWQRGGGYDRNIRSSDDLHEKMQYIHQNPVKRGLVARPEDWGWSSASWYLNGKSLIQIDRIPT